MDNGSAGCPFALSSTSFTLPVATAASFLPQPARSRARPATIAKTNRKDHFFIYVTPSPEIFCKDARNPGKDLTG
jgi:hypothetical protein